MAKMAKDIAAGCVFVSAIYAAIVGYLVFFKSFKIVNVTESMLRIRQSPWHVTAITLVALLSLVVIIKILVRKGTPLRGGWPSGHSALAFSIFTITAFLSDNLIVAALVFLMAVLLAVSRVRKGLHTAWEAFAGSALGILVTVLIFQLLYRG